MSIEVVTFGPGLHMLRDDNSPVKARIEALALSSPESPSEPAAIPRKYEQGRKQGDFADLSRASLLDVTGHVYCELPQKQVIAESGRDHRCYRGDGNAGARRLPWTR